MQTKPGHDDSLPTSERATWEAPRAELLDIASDTHTNNGLGSDAGAGSSHS